MSRGSIYFLGENPDFRVLTDQIWARNDFSGAAIMIPFKLEFSSLVRNGNQPGSRFEIFCMKGELRTEGGMRFSENLIMENYSLSQNNLSFQAQFQFSFTYDVLNKVEKKREGDLILMLSIAVQAVRYQEVVFNNNNINRSFISGLEKGNGHVNFQIPQSYWVNKILPQTGHDSFRLIELPAISQVIPEEYKSSLKELEEAKKYFLNGDYDKTVGHCRSALDPFKAKKGEVKTYVKSRSEFAWINDVLDATDEWLNKLVKSTSHFTSKAHHVPSVGHFDRTEAEIIMMVTTSLIAYIGKL